MSDTNGKRPIRGTVYTGEGFVPDSSGQERRPRRNMEESQGNRPRRRSELLREEDARASERAEQLRLEEEKKRKLEEEKARQEAEKRRKAEEEKARQAARKAQISAEKRQREEEKLRKENEEKARREEQRRQKESEKQQKAQTKQQKAQTKQQKTQIKQQKIQEKPQEKAVWQQKLEKRKKRRRNIALGILGGIAAIAYTVVAVHFSNHFYNDTLFYGIDCSELTLDEVKAEVSVRLDDYAIDIKEREGKQERITAKEIGLRYNDDGGIDQMLKAQRSYIWPIAMLMRPTVGANVTFVYDKDMAEKRIDDLVCMDKSNMVAPHDAYIQPTDDGFEVAPEVNGTTLDTDKTISAILGAMDIGEVEVDLEEEECYRNPTIYQDDEELCEQAAAMTEVASANFVIDFGEDQEVVNPALLEQWLTKTASGDYVINDVCVMDYVAEFGKKYDTYGMPVDFLTTQGTVESLYGGDYGWCLDDNATSIAVLKAIQEGYHGTLEPIWSETGKSHANNGIGYTYVEICISLQHMWCFQDGELVVETDVVTGNPNKKNATPSGGVWKIDSKERNATLVGEGYRTPVDYWMPFNDNVGIHDLQSRGAFGGTIYLYAGSHGCVNTPYEAVKTIYETVSVGTPVIVYE